ncbi:hypothetical protein ACFL6Y_03420 [Elusimicrobiota bacterium]
MTLIRGVVAGIKFSHMRILTAVVSALLFVFCSHALFAFEDPFMKKLMESIDKPDGIIEPNSPDPDGGNNRRSGRSRDYSRDAYEEDEDGDDPYEAEEYGDDDANAEPGGNGVFIPRPVNIELSWHDAIEIKRKFGNPDASFGEIVKSTPVITFDLDREMNGSYRCRSHPHESWLKKLRNTCKPRLVSGGEDTDGKTSVFWTCSISNVRPGFYRACVEFIPEPSDELIEGIIPKKYHGGAKFHITGSDSLLIKGKRGHVKKQSLKIMLSMRDSQRYCKKKLKIRRK